MRVVGEPSPRNSKETCETAVFELIHLDPPFEFTIGCLRRRLYDYRHGAEWCLKGDQQMSPYINYPESHKNVVVQSLGPMLLHELRRCSAASASVLKTFQSFASISPNVIYLPPVVQKRCKNLFPFFEIFNFRFLHALNFSECPNR